MEEAVFPWGTVLSIGIPSIIALIGVIYGHYRLGRSQEQKNANDLALGSEVNDTNAFKTVTDQLFKLNGELRDDLEKVKQELVGLRADVAKKDEQIASLEGDLEETDKKWRQQMGVTALLANYIRQLIAAWPRSVAPPPDPDPPIDWAVHLR